MEIIKLGIDEVFQDPNNANQHDQRSIDAIAGSLRKFGQQKPIVVGEKGVILAGNGTHAAAKSLGWKDIAVVKSTLKDFQAMAYALADNQTSKLADFDAEILNAQIELIAANDLDIDFSDFGFELPDLDGGESSEGLTDDDAVPEVDDNSYGVKHGDTWLLGEHRLMCGDSTSEADVDKLMNGEKAVFCFTSPPYSDQRDYKGDLELDPKHLAKFLKAPCDLFAVNLGMKRKDHEIVSYWDDYINAAKEYGHKFLSWNVWDKDLAGSISNQSAMFSIIHEWIFVFGKHKKLNKIYKNDTEANEKRRRYDPINVKGKSQRLVRQKDGTTKFSNRGDLFDHKQQGTVSVVTPVMARNINHPAMFPTELPEIYLLSCSNENDIVYEPFCGSGSTLIACEKTNRKCYGMEIDEHYCSVILKRFEDFAGKKPTLLKGE